MYSCEFKVQWKDWVTIKRIREKNEIKVCIVAEKGSCVTMISGLLCCMAPSQHGQ